ncbi:MAG: hypothetical protein KC933_09100 [Myxococcales bacterium]|nr:hypothetical protein [Myxococcales bacterium]
MRRLLLALLLLLSPGLAEASPWTLGRGQLLLQGSFDFQVADSEFIHEGGERRFPLRGRYTGTTFTVGARVGVADSLELELSLPLRVVSYTSDPVILVPYSGDDPAGALAHYQANLVDFSQASVGVGDLQVAGRYQLLRGPVALATELRVKAPTGYEGPQGTFGRQPETVEAFVEQQAELVRPDRVRDDVTLGDAQLDLSAQLLLGAAFATGTFLRASGGYNLRLGGAGDQVLGDLRVGQALGQAILLYAGGRVAYTVQAGKSVGVSIAAVDPGLPAAAYTGGANTLPYVRRLETSAVDVGGGFIWRVAPQVELNVGYSRTVWGRFTTATHSASVGLAVRRDI